MNKTLAGCAAVAPPSVRVYDSTRLNGVQEGEQALGSGVRDLAQADPPDSRTIFLSRHNNQSLSSFCLEYPPPLRPDKPRPPRSDEVPLMNGPRGMKAMPSA
jgi:hypothetical protein